LLNYTPVPWAFGTSGLRGLVKDITDLEAYINVKAALRHLLSIGDIRASSTVLAGDLRFRTGRIMLSMAAHPFQQRRCRPYSAIGQCASVAHLSNSDSQGRADAIVELALRKPDGILRQLERAFT
jgi:hypothetical protein